LIGGKKATSFQEHKDHEGAAFVEIHYQFLIKENRKVATSFQEHKDHEGITFVEIQPS
jgi:hypothetical protein